MEKIHNAMQAGYIKSKKNATTNMKYYEKFVRTLDHIYQIWLDVVLFLIFKIKRISNGVPVSCEFLV